MTRPECSYFGVCGGCIYQDVPYEKQLELKYGEVQEALQTSNVFPVIPSPKPYHYRHTISLSIKKRDGSLRFGFVGKDKRTFVPVESCAIADERINQYLPTAFERLMALPGKKPYKTSQIALRTGDEIDVVTSLREDRKKQLSCTVDGKRFVYAVSSFFQHNASILTDFVSAVRSLLVSPASSSKILIDLYSGVGLFSVSLADAYHQAVGIEEGYESVKLAEENAKANAVSNVSFYQGKVEQLIETLNFKNGSMDAVVDPPRTGLKREVIDVLKTIPIQKLMYISCSLEALKRDLELFRECFEIQAIQPVDLFPQTKHIETIVLLKKR